jgi:hypothetical protein
MSGLCSWQTYAIGHITHQIDKTHSTKGLRRTPSPLFKISTNGMGPEDKTGLATISRHV